jgi:hypothetical protein
MELSNQNKVKKLECLIRKKPVVETPEELVRQRLISQMVNEWGYPHSFLRVEVSLTSLSSFSTKKQAIPNRRLDVVAFTKNASGLLVPILVVECKKSVKDVSLQSLQQLLGYNYYVGASFIGLIAKESDLHVYSVHNLEQLTCIPTYQELLALFQTH